MIARMVVYACILGVIYIVLFIATIPDKPVPSYGFPDFDIPDEWRE